MFAGVHVIQQTIQNHGATHHRIRQYVAIVNAIMHTNVHHAGNAYQRAKLGGHKSVRIKQLQYEFDKNVYDLLFLIFFRANA